ncbi:MAG: hypothetical protein HRT61_21245 [Ekhidna sp.]|nr:hypothetical protein [Ekhidna sp.]
MPSPETEKEIKEWKKVEDLYRGRQLSWKVAYYASVLTGCGFFVAAASLNYNVVNLLITFCSLLCAIMIIENIRIYEALYNELGYDPNKLESDEDVSQKKERHNNSVEVDKEKAQIRKKRDRWIYRLFIAALSLFTFSQFANVLPNLITCVR